MDDLIGDAYFKASEDRAKLIGPSYFIGETELARLRKIEEAAREYFKQHRTHCEAFHDLDLCGYWQMIKALETK